MAYRSAGSRVSDQQYYDEYPPPPRRGPPPRDLEEEAYDRAPPRRAPVREYETDIDIREREPRADRVPAFMRDDHPRHTEAGPMVLRSREVETMDRRRPASPSPTRVRERINIERRRSPSPYERPTMERSRTRIIERSPPPAQMPAERRPRFIERSPSPPPRLDVRAHSRHVERRRPRSPTPEGEREHIRIIQRERERERVPSPSPPPSPTPAPQPEVIKGPTIEREVITHYRDIDHGVERVKAPTPPPPPRTAPPRTRTPPRTRETDIDIYTSRGETDIDIKRTRSRSRPPAREPRPAPPLPRPSYDDNELVIQTSSDRLRISEGHRRARSAAPPAPPKLENYDEEAEYITSKIDSRGNMGEAWNGATKDWTIIDVPPGTERVKMDGVGGGGAEVTWQRYNGVRRARFVPEREREDAGTTVSEPVREREPVADRDRFSVQIYDSRDRSRDRSVVEDVRDTHISIRDRDRERRPAKRQQDMWTEITKDLVVREAIERLGYEYEETEWFFYVMQYLRYEDVLELVNMSDTIRRERKQRAREIEWERESRARWEQKQRHRPRFDDELIIERDREVVFDRPSRRYH